MSEPAASRRAPSAPARAFFRLLTGTHKAMFRTTGGRLGGSGGGGKFLLLTTTGRTTGKRRTTPLMFVDKGKELLIIAANAGYDTHPAWYLNLQANPDATIQVGKEVRRVRARFAEDSEREQLWAEIAGNYKGYRRYQERTKRTIPLVLLSPAPDAAPGRG